MQEMQDTTVRKVIRYFGCITKVASKIGVSRTSIYRSGVSHLFVNG